MFYITLKSQIANSQNAKTQKPYPKTPLKNWFVENRDTLICAASIALVIAARIITGVA